MKIDASPKFKIFYAWNIGFVEEFNFLKKAFRNEVSEVEFIMIFGSALFLK
jgi:hypothetical protein